MPILGDRFTGVQSDLTFQQTKPVTLADLRDDDEFVKTTERFLESIGGGDNVTDLYGYFRGADWSLRKARLMAKSAQDFTEQQKKDYNYLKTKFDNAVVGGAGPERRLLAGNAIQGILSDPINYASALMIPWSGGTSFVGRVAGGEAVKQSIKEATKQGVKQTIQATITNIPGQVLKSPLSNKQIYGLLGTEGMIYGGTHDYVQQSVDLETYRRDKRDYLQTAKVAALGGVLAPATAGIIKGASYTIPKFMKAVNEERISRIDNNENYIDNYGGKGVKLVADVMDKGSKIFDFAKLTMLPVRPTSLLKRKADIQEKNIKSNFLFINNSSLKQLLQLFKYDADEFFVAPKLGEQKLLLEDYSQQLVKLWGNRREQLFDIFKKYKLREHHNIFSKNKRVFGIFNKQILSEETDKNLAYFLRTNQTTKLINGKVIKLPDNIINAGKEIRNLLDDIFDEAVETGLDPNKVTNYFPRAWRIDKIKKDKDVFIQKIMKAEGSSKESATELWEKLSTSNSAESSSVVGLSSRLKTERRLLKLKDDDFSEYLSNDIENVLLKYFSESSALITRTKLFGETTDDFVQKWINPIKETGLNLTESEETYLKYLYEITTGQRGRINSSRRDFFNLIPTGRIGQVAHDLLTVSMQTSMLGFSALTSIVEIGVPLLLGGRYKVGLQGMYNATKQSASEFWNKQKQNFGVGDPNQDVRPASRQDLNAFMNSVNLGDEDRIMAIYGQAMSRPATKIQNFFFKTIGLHDLTRWLQLVGYDMGKNLIYKNLKTLVDNPNLNKKDKLFLQDSLSELGINYKEGVEWIKRGGKHTDDYYVNNVRAAANRYTNEVVMNPTAASNQKPLIHSLATTKWMYGLLGYVTAFSNGPLRKVVRNLTKNNSRTGMMNNARAVTGALFMYNIGVLNYTIRTGGKNLEDLENGRISEEDFRNRALAYSGLAGPAEMFLRYEFAQRYESKIMAAVGSVTGPNLVDVIDYLTAFTQRGVLAETAFKRAPFSVALKSAHPEKYREFLLKARELDKQMGLGPSGPPDIKPEPLNLSTGGLITGPEVPYTKENAADRVDPFTGSPYSDQVARLGLQKGGVPEGAVRIYDEDQGLKPVLPVIELLVGGAGRILAPITRRGADAIEETLRQKYRTFKIPKEVYHGGPKTLTDDVIKSQADLVNANQAAVFTTTIRKAAEDYAQGKKGKVYEIDTLKNINAKIFNPTKIDRVFKTTINNEIKKNKNIINQADNTSVIGSRNINLANKNIKELNNLLRLDKLPKPKSSSIITEGNYVSRISPYQRDILTKGGYDVIDDSNVGSVLFLNQVKPN